MRTLTENYSNLSDSWKRLAVARAFWQTKRARTEQLPPDGEWDTWLYLAGRGAGKTRTAAEWLAYKAICYPSSRWAILAPTFGDGRDTCVEGESGLLTVLNRYGAVQGYNRSQGQIKLRNKSVMQIFSGEEPERLRGPQHHGAWVDELAAFRYMREAWDQLQFGLRLGDHPQVMVSTTPKPQPLIRELLGRTDGSVVVTRGSTFDNAKNLAPSALKSYLARYEGTRLGRQELYGEVIEDVEGALWTISLIDAHRVMELSQDIVRRVVSIDPAVSNNADSDETGIVIVSRDRQGHGYVEADLSMRGTPNEWATKAVNAFDEYECDAIVVEVNQGGDMVESTLRTIRPALPIKKIHASKGKRLRAEPISSMYEQGRIHHVGSLKTLEDQMASWTPDDPKSPDRLDALVHGLTELMSRGGTEAYLRGLAVVCECGFPNGREAVECTQCGKALRGIMEGLTHGVS